MGESMKSGTCDSGSLFLYQLDAPNLPTQASQYAELWSGVFIVEIVGVVVGSSRDCAGDWRASWWRSDPCAPEFSGTRQEFWPEARERKHSRCTISGATASAGATDSATRNEPAPNRRSATPGAATCSGK